MYAGLSVIVSVGHMSVGHAMQFVNLGTVATAPRTGTPLRTLPCITGCTAHDIVDHCHFVTMRSLAVSMVCFLAVLALSTAQDQTFVQQAQKQNLVDVQFFADARYMLVHTPWAYYDFNPIQVGACTACSNFQVSSAGPFALRGQNHDCANLPCNEIGCIEAMPTHGQNCAKHPVQGHSMCYMVKASAARAALCCAGRSNSVGLCNGCLLPHRRRGDPFLQRQRLHRHANGHGRISTDSAQQLQLCLLPDLPDILLRRCMHAYMLLFLHSHGC